jgi:uncharacterized protein YerC
MIFYPALQKLEETHDLTLEAYEEHKVVKTLLAELSGAKSATDEWQARAKVLRENVEHHVDEEENELFDKADDVLSDEEIESLGERMAAEKALKQGQPVPKKSDTKYGAIKTVAKPGIISTIAEVFGLGSGTAKKATRKATKKAATKKKTAAVAKRPTKAVKSTRAALTKRPSTKQMSKRASSTKSHRGSKKQSGVGNSSKSTKKRVSQK